MIKGFTPAFFVALIAASVAAPLGCSSNSPGAAAPLTVEAGVDSGITVSVSPDGSPAAASGDGSVTPGCDGIDLTPPTSGVQYQIEQTLLAGQEQEVCQLVKLGADMDVNSTDGIMSVGAHHALVYATAYNAVTNPLPPTTRDGQTIDGTKVHPCLTPSALWDVQQPVAGARYQSGSQYELPINGPGVLPPNVAFKFKAGDYLLLNFHMLNPSADAVDVCYKANLTSVPDSQVTIEAGTIFWYNSFITVPANGTSTARMACPITKDISLASAVSHAHMRLVNYTANLVSGDPTLSSTTMVQNLYTGTNWDLPPTRVFGTNGDGGGTATPLSLHAGQWIDYECNYKNNEARNVAQGFQTTDEMCMFVGVYWPRDPNLDFCLAPTPAADASVLPLASSDAGVNEQAQVFATGGYIFGYGTGTGADFLSCFWQSPQLFSGGGPSTAAARFASDSCITQTCPKASPPIVAYTTCLGDYGPACTAQCTALQSSFQDVCAATPASSATANDGCQAEYGTTGSDGTCAASAGAAAVAACTTPAQVASLTQQCQSTFCAAACSDAGAPATTTDAGADASPPPVTCAQCMGAFTASTPPPANPTCLNELTFACIQAQATTATKNCVTQCFTSCITTRATGCTVDCLNQTACPAEYGAIATATCN